MDISDPQRPRPRPDPWLHYIVPGVALILIVWGALTVTFAKTEQGRVPFGIVAALTISTFLTWVAANTFLMRPGQKKTTWHWPRFGMLNLLVAIGFFGCVIASAIFILGGPGGPNLSESASLIVWLPTTSVGIGGGVGALYKEIWLGIKLALTFQCILCATSLIVAVYLGFIG